MEYDFSIVKKYLVLRVIFTVEMRTAPFIKIDFENSSYVVRNIIRSMVDVKFEVFDTSKNAFIKNADDIIIKSVILDARIYDEDELPPVGFI